MTESKKYVIGIDLKKNSTIVICTTDDLTETTKELEFDGYTGKYTETEALKEYVNEIVLRTFGMEKAQKLDCVVLTTDQTDNPIDLDSDVIHYLSYEDCFVSYLFNSKEGKITGRTGLFYLNEKHFTFVKVNSDINTEKALYSIEKIGLQKDQITEQLRQCLTSNLVNTLYFSGTGFQKEDVVNHYSKYCAGKHLFWGQNLYAFGAYYSALRRATLNETEYCIVGGSHIREQILFVTRYDNEDQSYELARIGQNWWEVDTRLTIILDETDALSFLIRQAFSKETIEKVFRPDGLTLRENKTIRLELRLKYIDQKTALLTVRDLGFGDWYPTNYRVWEQKLT